jgi:elongator complex protein 3
MIPLKDLLYQDINQPSLTDWDKTKRRWAKVLKQVPKNSQILKAYQTLVQAGRIKPNLSLEQSLRIRQVRTLSGVAPFAIMMQPFYCPGKCIYCPLEPGMPKSYLSDEPAAARAKKLKFDPGRQLRARLKQFHLTGHKPEKLQVIVIGGTFSAYPDAYKRTFLKAIFDAANGKVAHSIAQAQKRNETAKYRIIGMSIETRPDWVTDEEIELLRKYGVTKVQLGVQTLDESVNRLTKRGHDVAAVTCATRKLRDAGFKINYHLMPNLPGSTPKKDIAQAKKLFADARFRPDTLKVYPCVVVPHSELYDWWKAGKYQPYDDQTLLDVLIKIKQLVPRYCRIDRLVRDISRQWTAAGTLRTNMRQMANAKLRQQDATCVCIRCREIKNQSARFDHIRLKTTVYRTSGGEEHFIEVIDDRDNLYGLLRLRFPGRQAQKQPLFPVLKQGALIRELQVFGQQLPLSTPGVESSRHAGKRYSQHRSLGKQLMIEAENQARKGGYKKLAIISGVGVRNYYRKLGYRLQGTYMVKSLRL